MRAWLSAAAVMPLLWAAAAQAQAMKGLLATDVAAVARQHIIDLRLYRQQGNESSPSLIRGMIAQQDVSANAFVGVGLAEIYSRKKGGLRIAEAPVLSREPAVTFVVKF